MGPKGSRFDGYIRVSRRMGRDSFQSPSHRQQHHEQLGARLPRLRHPRLDRRVGRVAPHALARPVLLDGVEPRYLRVLGGGGNVDGEPEALVERVEHLSRRGAVIDIRSRATDENLLLMVLGLEADEAHAAPNASVRRP
jgi:hypothetical protein